MTKYSVSVKNIKGFSNLDVTFDFTEEKIIVLTGKNGIGKTTLVKSFKQVYDPKVFEVTSSLGSLNHSSEVEIQFNSQNPIRFTYNKKISILDTKDRLPKKGYLKAELPIPYGERFKHYSEVSAIDSELRVNYASSNYEEAKELISFLSSIYGGSNKFNELKRTLIKGQYYYFLPKDDNYYLREDHFSSGEYFLIQLYRLIKSAASLVIIDEVDISLDAAAQVRLYGALKKLLGNAVCSVILISHSLAFMKTVADGGLYYLESKLGCLSLSPRSYGYVKTDLYGFSGFDRYILTEDSVLEGFLEYLISYFSLQPFYRYKIIGVGGIDQLLLLVEKNDEENILADSGDVLCVMDGDAVERFDSKYSGPTLATYSLVEDLEKYIYVNRVELLGEIPLPEYTESDKVKTASKTYWKYLTNDMKLSPSILYQIIIDNNKPSSETLFREIKGFLEKN